MADADTIASAPGEGAHNRVATVGCEIRGFKADGSVVGAINVRFERLRANCRVAVRSAVPARVIIQERVPADSGVIIGVIVLKKRRRTRSSGPASIGVAR